MEMKQRGTKILEDVVSLGNNDSVKLKDSTNKLVSIILSNMI